MKTFLRKVKLSFLAMLCGWIACNIAWWVGYSPYLARQESAHMPIAAVLQIGLATGIVILIAWFLIFLPVDLVVPDVSPLRRPGRATLCGFAVTLLPFVVSFVITTWPKVARDGVVKAMWENFDVSAMPYVLGTCATGAVAAFARSLMKNSNRERVP